MCTSCTQIINKQILIMYKPIPFDYHSSCIFLKPIAHTAEYRIIILSSD